eukprot:768536-Hanusia_phi.AAC.17
MSTTGHYPFRGSIPINKGCNSMEVGPCSMGVGVVVDMISRCEGGRVGKMCRSRDWTQKGYNLVQHEDG